MFNNSNQADEDILGIKINNNVSGADTPNHQRDWCYSRITGFGTPPLTSNPPYWVTISGKVYFESDNGEEELEVAIQYSDDHTENLKIIKATKTPQDFALHFYSKNFNGFHDTSHGYMDVESKPLNGTDIVICISHLKVELGKEYYPIWTPAPEDLEYRLKQLEGKVSPAADPGMSGTDGPE